MIVVWNNSVANKSRATTLSVGFILISYHRRGVYLDLLFTFFFSPLDFTLPDFLPELFEEDLEGFLVLFLPLFFVFFTFLCLEGKYRFPIMKNTCFS